MKVMMLIAHGSRKQAANDEAKRLVGQVYALCGKDFHAVVSAFLEIAQPEIQAAFDHCADLGADEVGAVPCFLAAGRHVHEDIPGEIACARAGHREINIELSQYVGDNNAMAALVIEYSHQAAR